MFLAIVGWSSWFLLCSASDLTWNHLGNYGSKKKNGNFGVSVPSRINYLTRGARVFVSFGTNLSIVATWNLNSSVLVMAGGPSPAKPNLNGKRCVQSKPNTSRIRFGLICVGESSSKVALKGLERIISYHSSRFARRTTRNRTERKETAWSEVGPPTWAELAPNSGQLAPTWAQLEPNWAQHGATWAHLDASWA